MIRFKKENATLIGRIPISNNKKIFDAATMVLFNEIVRLKWTDMFLPPLEVVRSLTSNSKVVWSVANSSCWFPSDAVTGRSVADDTHTYASL